MKYRHVMWPTYSGFSSVGPSRRSCRLLNLFFQDEDALPLLWRQHGDLFRGELQHLHDECSLDGGGKKNGMYILHLIFTQGDNVLLCFQTKILGRVSLVSYVIFNGNLVQLWNQNSSLKASPVTTSYCFLTSASAFFVCSFLLLSQYYSQWRASSEQNKNKCYLLIQACIIWFFIYIHI